MFFLILYYFEKICLLPTFIATFILFWLKAFCSDNTNEDSCGEYLCGFWEAQLFVWSQSGCSLNSMSESFIECQCNHLTNFATLFVSCVSSANMFYNILVIKLTAVRK